MFLLQKVPQVICHKSRYIDLGDFGRQNNSGEMPLLQFPKRAASRVRHKHELYLSDDDFKT